MIDLIIIGAGGFALEVIDLVEQINSKYQTYKIVGFLDDNRTGEVLPRLSVIGTLYDFENFKHCAFVVAIANPTIRAKVFSQVKKSEVFTPNIIHPDALISNYANLRKDSGIIVNAFATLSSKCKILEGVIVDSNVYVGHETLIKQFVTVYAGALISGNVQIDEYSQIGLGSKIIQGNKIGSNTFIGANSTVVSNIKSDVIAVGTPCKVIKENINYD